MVSINQLRHTKIDTTFVQLIGTGVQCRDISLFLFKFKIGIWFF